MQETFVKNLRVLRDKSQCKTSIPFISITITCISVFAFVIVIVISIALFISIVNVIIPVLVLTIRVCSVRVIWEAAVAGLRKPTSCQYRCTISPYNTRFSAFEQHHISTLHVATFIIYSFARETQNSYTVF